MADPTSALLLAAAGAIALWVLDKIAGTYVADWARKLLPGKEKTSLAVDRLTKSLEAIEAEHESLKALTVRLIADRDHYLNLYLTAQRDLRAKRPPDDLPDTRTSGDRE